MSKIIVPLNSKFNTSNTRLTRAIKSVLNDTALVGLFVGGWLTLDGIFYLVPSEAATGAAITLTAAVLRVVVKAGK